MLARLQTASKGLQLALDYYMRETNLFVKVIYKQHSLPQKFYNLSLLAKKIIKLKLSHCTSAPFKLFKRF